MYLLLSMMTHGNGAPVVSVFGRHSAATERCHTQLAQGSILNLNVLDPHGATVGYRLVEDAAAAAGIHLRAGCECNPGACFANLGVTPQEVEAVAAVRTSCSDDVEFIDVVESGLDDNDTTTPPAKDAASHTAPHTTSVCSSFGIHPRDKLKSCGVAPTSPADLVASYVSMWESAGRGGDSEARNRRAAEEDGEYTAAATDYEAHSVLLVPTRRRGDAPEKTQNELPPEEPRQYGDAGGSVAASGDGEKCEHSPTASASRVRRKALGSVRISLGWLTTLDDVERVVDFIRSTFRVA